jgi:subfamily B ATP-binding cassette protein MsbA
VIKNGDTVVQAANAQSKLSFIWAFLEALSQGINILLSLLVLAVSLYFFAKGMISLGDVVLFVTVAGKLAVPFLQIESSYRDFVRLAGDYSKYRDVLELPPEPDQGKQEFPVMYANIYCKNLSFTYPETTREVLH